MESAGRLRHQEPHPARAASEPAPSDAYVGNPGGLPGTQERRRTRHPNALARVAISRTPHRHVETPRSYGALATCVQPKIWVTISPKGEGCVSDLGTPGVQPKVWVTTSPMGEGNTRLPTAYCLLPTAHRPLPTAHYLLPTAYCPLPTARCLLPSALRQWTGVAGAARSWIFFMRNMNGIMARKVRPRSQNVSV